MKTIALSFIEAYKLQLKGEPVTCAKTGKQISTDRKPTVAVYDVSEKLWPSWVLDVDAAARVLRSFRTRWLLWRRSWITTT